MSRTPFTRVEMARLFGGGAVASGLIVVNFAWPVFHIHPFWGALAAFGWARLAPSRLAIALLFALGLFEDGLAGNGWGLMASVNLIAYFLALRTDVIDIRQSLAWVPGLVATLFAASLSYYGLRVMFVGEWPRLGACALDFVATLLLAAPALYGLLWVGAKRA